MNNTYEPFGNEWINEVMKMRKHDLVMILAATAKKSNHQQELLDKCLQYIENEEANMKSEFGQSLINNIKSVKP